MFRAMLYFVALSGAASASPVFQFAPTAGTPTEVIDGLARAGALWSRLLTEDVTILIDVDFAPSSAAILGATNAVRLSMAYSDVGAGLLADSKSADDITAMANVPAGAATNVLINHTADHPSGPGDTTPYVDDDGGMNNRTVVLSKANVKALGFPAPPGTDAVMTFNSSFSWDFDSSDGIATGSYDFVGVVAHEIGHVLGFNSRVDLIDCYDGPGPGPCTVAGNPGPFSEDSFGGIELFDLFRYSADSFTAGAPDVTADTRDKYFSIDGGVTPLALFSTGAYNGDGWHASHWKDNLQIGIFDPTLAEGELAAIRSMDLRALDVIGWDLATEVPEPGNLALVGAGVLALVARRVHAWRHGASRT